jgi:hypothetical protein
MLYLLSNLSQEVITEVTLDIRGTTLHETLQTSVVQMMLLLVDMIEQ